MGLNIQLGGRRNRGVGNPTSIFGKLFLTAFLSIFIAAGVFFGVLILGEVQEGFDQQGWVERPCTVIDSRVEINGSSNDPYTANIEYTYTHDGREYQGSSLANGASWTRDYREAQAVVLNYPPGSRQRVFVNPNEPSESVVQISTAKSLMALAMGIVFIAAFSGIPLIIVIAMWWPGGKKGAVKERAHKARTRGKNSRGGKAVGVLFGGVFTAAGGVMLIFMTVLPLVRTASAQGWNQLACTIERSEVLSYSDSDGTTYRIDILFFYDVDGERYGSNRYSFSQIGSSSGYEGKREATERYPEGSQATCYVDPNDPTKAVLHRGLTLGNLLGLFPIPFLGAGLLVMYFSLFGSAGGKANKWRPGKRKTNRKAKSTQVDRGVDGFVNRNEDDGSSGPIVLRPRGSRIGGFVGMTLVALFWNGIVGVFIYNLAGGWIKGKPDICPSLFMVPFIIVGLVLIGAAVKQLMLIFAPSVVVTLDRRSLPLGGATRLRWHVVGGTGRVESVTIKLIGEEQATYRRGTDTITDTSEFYEALLVGDEDENRDDAYAPKSSVIDRGNAVLRVPQDTMHSFESDNNKIVWRLSVWAAVSRWPDPKDTYELTVLPIAIETNRSRRDSI